MLLCKGPVKIRDNLKQEEECAGSTQKCCHLNHKVNMDILLSTHVPLSLYLREISSSQYYALSVCLIHYKTISWLSKVKFISFMTPIIHPQHPFSHSALVFHHMNEMWECQPTTTIMTNRLKLHIELTIIPLSRQY